MIESKARYMGRVEGEVIEGSHRFFSHERTYQEDTFYEPETELLPDAKLRDFYYQ